MSHMPPPRAAVPRRRASTRLRICEAAAALVARQGFSATSVDQIAARAGVAKGTVYYNFRGKDALFGEVLAYGGEAVTAELIRAADDVHSHGGSPPAALREVLRAALALIERHPELTRLCATELWRTGRAWHDTLAAAREQAVSVVERALGQCAASGDLDEGADLAVLAAGLVGTVLAAGLDWQTFQPHRPLEEVHAGLLPLLPLPSAGSAATVGSSAANG